MNKPANLPSIDPKLHFNSAYLSLIKGSIGILVNPEHTDSVFDIEDGLRQLAVTRELFNFTTQEPEVISLVRERYLKPVPNLNRLRNLPEGSLGRAYARHLDDNNFDPNYYRKIEVRNDTDYILMRIRQTHDIWHVVTGFDTDALGEIAIKGVELSQTHRPMAAVICAGGIFRYMLKQPAEFGKCIEAIAAGYSLGLKARPLLGVKWEEMWDRQLDELRASLKISPFLASKYKIN